MKKPERNKEIRQKPDTSVVAEVSGVQSVKTLAPQQQQHLSSFHQKQMEQARHRHGGGT